MTNWSNESNSNHKGGYQSLIVYQLATTIYDLNYLFCQKFLNSLEFRRTKEQMVQAARSGKQNIVEGSLENSMESNIKLTGVARASFGELLEDYKDFLRINRLSLWDKNSPQVLQIRSSLSNKTNWTNWTNSSEDFANLMITLINVESFLLDRLLKSQEEKFVKEGGFREKLFKKRIDYRNQQNY